VARMFCDIQNPDGTPSRSDPRYVLKRKTWSASRNKGYSFLVSDGNWSSFYCQGARNYTRSGTTGGYFDADHRRQRLRPAPGHHSGPGLHGHRCGVAATTSKLLLSMRSTFATRMRQIWPTRCDLQRSRQGRSPAVEFAASCPNPSSARTAAECMSTSPSSRERGM